VYTLIEDIAINHPPAAIINPLARNAVGAAKIRSPQRGSKQNPRTNPAAAKINP
jgi:hypothetical protein